MTRATFFPTRYRPILLALLVFGFSAASAMADHNDNKIYSDLLQTGIPLSNGNTVVLQQPVMADGLSTDAQRKIIVNLVSPRLLADFLKGKLSDPYERKLTAKPGPKPDDSKGKMIDLYFIANGNFETVANKNFLKQQFNGGNGKAVFLTDKELKERNLSVVDDAKMRERYAHVHFDLINKVLIDITGHGIQTHAKDSELIAFMLDPQFAKDPKFPNQWQTIKQNEKTGKKEFGEPQPYAGAGGYVKMTRLVLGQTPQIFVEYHLVYDEPNGWPDLTSHIDERLKSDVRSYRNDILAFQKELEAQKKADEEAAKSPAGPKK